MKRVRSRGEMELAASERQATRAQAEHDIALQERAEHIARLRAMRLAKEARDRERAANATNSDTATSDHKPTT